MLSTVPPSHVRGQAQTNAVMEETSSRIAALICGAECFSKGVPIFQETLAVKEEEFSKPKNNQLYQIFMGLKAFGYDGIYGNDIFEPDGLYHAFASLHVPLDWVYEFFGTALPPTVCEPIFQAAFARCKLEEGNNPPETFLWAAGGQVIGYEEFLPGGEVVGLIPYELSLLARMTESAVRNSIAADDSIRKIKGDAKYIEVPIEDAQRWLEGTRGFTPTRRERNTGNHLLEVPYADDGSCFQENCRRSDGKFSVGKKGQEEKIESFSEALSSLNFMDIPYWRRPHPKTGVPGIVRGRGLVAKTRKELGLD
jgi:hypothetical protein